MNQTVINFTANNQRLALSGEPLRLASKTVNFVKAHFELGENWDGFDSVRAVWSTDFNKGVSAVLDSLGDCVVPHEVLTRAGKVRVNLVGSISEGNVLTDRLTTCLVSAIEVCCNVPVDGTNSQTITPTQFEQFVEAVRDDADRAETASTEARESANEASESATSASQSASASAESATASEQAKQSAQASAQNAQISAQTAENAKDNAELARDEILGMRAEAVTLPEGSEATASYADGLLSLGIPRGNTGDKGDKGDTGETGATPNLTIGNVETLEPTESATATITGTAENPVLNLGIPQGDTGEVSLADLSTLLPTDTASGEIASFPDGQSVIPLLSLLADIEPIQEGSGTPSPDNVRPISGHTECVTQRTGKNLLDASIFKDQRAWNAGEIKLQPNTQYTVSSNCDGNIVYLYVMGVGQTPNPQTEVYQGHTISVTSDANGILRYQQRVPNLSAGSVSDYWYQIELGTTATDYEPYQGTTYTTDLGQTVYGGKLDVVSGELTVDRGYIASYNGETLPSTWISDRDEYASGTTPTIGAEVVYYLATPKTIQLTPQEVYALLGQNNVWADSGSVEVVYKADVTKWVEKKLNS